MNKGYYVKGQLDIAKLCLKIVEERKIRNRKLVSLIVWVAITVLVSETNIGILEFLTQFVLGALVFWNVERLVFLSKTQTLERILRDSSDALKETWRRSNIPARKKFLYSLLDAEAKGREHMEPVRCRPHTEIKNFLAVTDTPLALSRYSYLTVEDFVDLVARHHHV